MLTSTMSRLSYARVLVEVNLLFDLPYSIEVTLPSGSLFHQQVVYETLPRFCKHYITLGHLTSTCTKFPPSNAPSKQPAHDSTHVPKGTRGRDSVFNRLGPQEGTPVVKCSEANIPAKCLPTPMQVEAELVSESGAVAPDSGGWEIVQSKRVRRKPSPLRHPTRSPHVEPCPAQGLSHIGHRDRQPSPPISVSPTISAPAPNDLAGFRTDKGKSMVVSSALDHFTSRSTGMPLRKRAQQRTGGISGRGKGLLPTPPS